MLKLYNTLSRQKEIFNPIVPGKAGMYVCGMTVYDYCHLGHARVMVVFDMVARYLRHSGYALTYVRNITDIDDKIIKRAAENGESIEALTQRFIDAMHEDEAALGVLPVDQEPRATTAIADMLSMIQRLIERGYAYQGNNNDVYYAVAQFAGYGRLSGKNPDDLRAGERVGVDEAKRDPLDFVLWKSAKPGEPSWDSPWGPGRPGWHIECSAMSTCCLGRHFDIHGGGMDLQFPHHENEIAQSEAATGVKFVNYWLHNGFVRVDEEKMSKSLGNFFSVREVLKAYPRPGVIRLFILSSHYRSPLNYATEQLDKATADLTTLYIALRGVAITQQTDAGANYCRRFQEAMDDDFNTPAAVAVLFELAHETNRNKQAGDHAAAATLAATLKALGGVLGLLQDDPDAWLKIEAHAPATDGAMASDALTAAAIDELVMQRLQARKNKEWATSDRIRDALKAQGVVLEDGPEGTTWRRV
ncbi:MAG: cysteine--tRNA ligase [Methylococcaceae bacterium]|nr:MAG: cysteine--tRNA ligase [Methylococcaceae bacterium]